MHEHTGGYTLMRRPAPVSSSRAHFAAEIASKAWHEHKYKLKLLQTQQPVLLLTVSARERRRSAAAAHAWQLRWSRSARLH